MCLQFIHLVSFLSLFSTFSLKPDSGPRPKLGEGRASHGRNCGRISARSVEERHFASSIIDGLTN